MDINEFLFLLILLDAVIVLGLGIAAAIFILFDIKQQEWMGRIPHAAFVLVLSSLAFGGLLWGADFLFGSGG